MSEAKIEFAVQLIDENGAKIVKKSLSNVGNVDINIELGRVIVHTKLPWSDIQNKIEQTGRKAVLTGFGGSAAVAMINNQENRIKGVVRFCSIGSEESGCVIDGTVDGLSPGLHGIHIHECGDLSLGCRSVGDHYNPRNSPHGSPDDPPNSRHAGDLGNIRADENGRATFHFIDPIINVWEIIGRSVVVTQDPDDRGKGQNERSLVDGNSGKRLACGIIARAAGIYQNYKKICACDGVSLWDERNVPIAGKERSKNDKK